MKKRMYIWIWMLCATCLSFQVEAQTQSAGTGISLNAFVPAEWIPAEACRNLENKLTRAIAANSFADNGYVDRFVLTAKVDVLSKDVVPSTPPRVSQKLEVTFMVGDVIENKVYGTATVSLAGIGTNETKAFIAAFSRINPQQKELQDMLKEAREKIVAFYSNNCDAILANAEALVKMQKYDEAIFRLMSVPDVCRACYEKCQKAAAGIYQQKIDAEGVALLNQAKTVWMKQPDAEGAQEVAALISRIDPKAKNYNAVTAFRNEVGGKLQADAKREWDFKMKQYEDEQALNRSIVEACRAIGVAFGEGQPETVTETVVYGWW